MIMEKEIELNLSRFATYFKEARRKSKLTNKEVAQRANLSEPFIDKIAGGHIVPAVDKIVVLSRVLGINSWEWIARLDPNFQDDKNAPQRVVQLPDSFDRYDVEAVEDFIAGRKAFNEIQRGRTTSRFQGVLTTDNLSDLDPATRNAILRTQRRAQNQARANMPESKTEDPVTKD